MVLQYHGRPQNPTPKAAILQLPALTAAQEKATSRGATPEEAALEGEHNEVDQQIRSWCVFVCVCVCVCVCVWVCVVGLGFT